MYLATLDSHTLDPVTQKTAIRRYQHLGTGPIFWKHCLLRVDPCRSKGRLSKFGNLANMNIVFSGGF